MHRRRRVGKTFAAVNIIEKIFPDTPPHTHAHTHTRKHTHTHTHTDVHIQCQLQDVCLFDIYRDLFTF